jgi:hypothetical protein
MKKQSSVVTETTKFVDETADSLSAVVTKTETQIDKVVSPARKRVLQRFPSLFLLLITLGVTATILGLEQLILQVEYLRENPSLVLIIGLSLLIFTGTLYKKLG